MTTLNSAQMRSSHARRTHTAGGKLDTRPSLKSLMKITFGALINNLYKLLLHIPVANHKPCSLYPAAKLGLSKVSLKGIVHPKIKCNYLLTLISFQTRVTFFFHGTHIHDRVDFYENDSITHANIC